MRALLAGEFALAASRDTDIYLKVEVQNASGTWIDVGAALGKNWITNGTWGEHVDTHVSQASFSFVQAIGAASLAPLMTASALNVDDLGAYAPLLELGRLVRASSATMGYGVALDAGKYRQIFTGRIDEVKGLDSPDRLGPITIACSDLGAWLMDLQIETEGTQYGTKPVGTALETVLQNVINANIPVGEPAVTLVKQSTSSFAVTNWKQGATKLMEALISLVLDSVGEDIRYRYNSSHVSTLQWFNPDRDRVTVDGTLAPNEYVLTRNDRTIANIRNAGALAWADEVLETSGTVTATSASSIAKYRRRFFRLPASSMLATQAEAQTVINVVVNDLSVAPEEATAECAYLWFVQLYDRYTFTENDRQFDTDQTFAVVGYQHTIESGRASTVMTVSGKIVGAYAEWDKRIKTSKPVPPSATITLLSETLKTITVTLDVVTDPVQVPVSWQYRVVRDAGVPAWTTLAVGGLPSNLTVTRSPFKQASLELKVIQPDGQSDIATYTVQGEIRGFIDGGGGRIDEDDLRSGGGGVPTLDQRYFRTPVYDSTGTQLIVDPDDFGALTSLRTLGSVKDRAKMSISTGPQTISNDTLTFLNFTTEDFDVGAGLADVGTDRITIPTDNLGLWVLHLTVRWAANATGYRLARIEDQSGTAIAESGIAAAPTVETQQHLWTLVNDPAAGNWYKCQVKQTSGGNLDALNTVPKTSIECFRLW